MNTKLSLATVTLGLLTATAVMPYQLHAAPGDLDTTFGTDGKVTTDFSGNPDSGKAVALQSDGKIVVAGFAQSGADVTTSNFAIARYNQDGTLDSTFGTGGKVTTDFAGSQDVAWAVAIQGDGKIIAAGQSQNGTETDFALARYNSDGSLDTSFGAGAGKVRTIFIDPFQLTPQNSYARGIAIQEDKKIVVAGRTFSGFTSDDFALARYNTDGSLDTTFGSSGLVTTDFFSQVDLAFTLVLQPDGKIVVAGSASTFTGDFDFALVRYDSDGSLDTTFGPDGNGKVHTDFSASTDIISSITLQADGAIVAAGSTSLNSGVTNDFALARYYPDGSLDTSFGSDGEVTTDFSPTVDDVAITVVVQPDGAIVAAGYTEGSSGDLDFALARYNSGGSLDLSFGVGGKVTTAISTGDDYIRDLVLQPDGRVIAAGTGGSNGDFAVARYLTGLITTKPLNISTRAEVGIGDNVLIGGFIITGTDSKKVILRAIGPSLPLSGATSLLTDPILELHQPDGTVVTNDNWRDTQEQEIIDTGIPPTNDLESAIVAILDPGAYTAIVSGKDGGTGIGLVEAYDLDQVTTSQLANISGRGFVGTDDNVLIGGFIIGGSDNATVVVRGIGPSLGASVTDPLQDPTIELHDPDGMQIAFDDDWKDSQQAEIEAAGLAPTDDREAAVLIDLVPGPYTAIVRGKDNTTGVGLVEAYNLP